MPSSLGVNVGAAAEVFEPTVRGEGPAVANPAGRGRLQAVRHAVLLSKAH